jgi:LAO/AO transport system kinase
VPCMAEPRLRYHVRTGALPSLSELRGGNKRVVARALAAIEIAAGTQEVAELLDTACAAARAHVIGLTGPPGVGKSTLANALVARARERGETVGIIAVDPSSRHTGGALLGDRARIATAPEDQGVYLRSMAARDRLGGLSEQTVAAMVLLRAIYDRVIVESVGIGQSESDTSFVADTLLLLIQPGAGDSLQFMKAGVLETPDVVVVTKADIGAPARRTRADLEAAIALNAETGYLPPVVLVSAAEQAGLDDLERAVARHRAFLTGSDRLERRRARQQRAWVEEAIRARFGSAGLAIARRLASGDDGPFTIEHMLARELSSRLDI